MGSTVQPNFAFGGCFMFIIWLAVTVLMTWAFCRICTKAGHNWALGLLMLVPIANMILILYLAFAEWPVQIELQAQRNLPGQTQAVEVQ